MNSFHQSQSDVAGTCPVEYEIEGSSWGTKTIKKTKDLLGCTERMGHFTAFQSTPYSVQSVSEKFNATLYSMRKYNIPPVDYGA